MKEDIAKLLKYASIISTYTCVLLRPFIAVRAVPWCYTIICVCSTVPAFWKETLRVKSGGPYGRGKSNKKGSPTQQKRKKSMRSDSQMRTFYTQDPKAFFREPNLKGGPHSFISLLAVNVI